MAPPADKSAPDWAQIEADFAAMLADDGYELVLCDVRAGRGAMVQVAVDHRDAPGTITVDECAEVSRRLGRYLDRLDPMRGAYRLLVSSPGVDRPLARWAQCEQAVGRQVKVTYRREGTKATVSGRLTEAADEMLRVEVEDSSIAIAWPEVVKANVVYDWGD